MSDTIKGYSHDQASSDNSLPPWINMDLIHNLTLYGIHLGHYNGRPQTTTIRAASPNVNRDAHVPDLCLFSLTSCQPTPSGSQCQTEVMLAGCSASVWSASRCSFFRWTKAAATLSNWWHLLLAERCGCQADCSRKDCAWGLKK